MKTIVTSIIFSFAAFAVQGQNLKESAVPANVVRNFQESFKDVKNVSWEKEKNGNYEAEYIWNNTKSTAVFNAEGVLLGTENNLALSELPKAAADHIARNYAGYTLSEVKQVIAPTGTSHYEAELKKGSSELELSFDAAGNFLKKEVED